MAYLGNGPPTTSAAMRLLLLQKAGLAHLHEIADVNGLRTELDALAAGGGGGGGGGGTVVPNATTTVAGKVMLATVADISSTVPSNKVVTVDVLKQSNKAGIERLKRFFESNF